MLDRVANLLIDTEAAYFEAQRRHAEQECTDTRRALKQAYSRLEDAKAEAESLVASYLK